eukprot:14826749-Alexandrium_andersonii.AAC.1
MPLPCKMNVLRDAEGHNAEAQGRAQEHERKLGVAEGLNYDNEELRERAQAKDAQGADMHRQMGEQRTAFDNQMALVKSQKEEQLTRMSQ